MDQNLLSNQNISSDDVVIDRLREKAGANNDLKLFAKLSEDYTNDEIDIKQFKKEKKLYTKTYSRIIIEHPDFTKE